ncbi:MAG: CoA-binding protein [Nanoarchaeota archaeon]|nr:CoA-binding protein [Nanoarchaeota archaeon]
MPRDLRRLFNPRSVVVIGASRNPGAVGYGVLKGLHTGGFFPCVHGKPFPGKIYAVNPKATNIQGIRSYPSINQVPGKPDLAIFCIPAKIIPMVMQDCIKKGIKNAIIISAGFAEFGEQGKHLQAELKRIIKGKVNVVGPNCLGVINTHSKMNASFGPTMPPVGHIGFITQSGALADSIIDWSVTERYGFSTLISFGNGMDLDAADYLEYLGRDPKTKAITIYLEGISDGRKFMRIAKQVTKRKPVIVIKAGRTESGQKAISSHTGSLAGSYKTYEAAFKQCGVIVVDTVEELFDTAKALSHQPPCKNGIAIITNGGGAGVLTADNCDVLGVKLTEFDELMLKRLDKTQKMHPAYSRRNPLDLVGDALPERYEAALDIVMSNKDVHGAIVLQTLQTMTDTVADAKIVTKIHKKYPRKPIICVYMGGKFSAAGVEFLEEHNIPDYNDPRKAALAMKALIDRWELLRS